MKTTSLLLFFLGTFVLTQGSRVCIDSHMCCELEEAKGVTSCKTVCDPIENCDTTDGEEDKIAVEEFVARPAIAVAAYSAPPICRKGFRLDSTYKCKRVFGATLEKATEAPSST